MTFEDFRAKARELKDRAIRVVYDPYDPGGAEERRKTIGKTLLLTCVSALALKTTYTVGCMVGEAKADAEFKEGMNVLTDNGIVAVVDKENGNRILDPNDPIDVARAYELVSQIDFEKN